MESTYLILTVLCLIGLSIRTVYELSKQAGKVDPTNKVVFSVVCIGMCLMLLSWPFLSLFDPYPLPIPGVLRFSGYLVITLGLSLAIGGVIQLKGLENIDHLVKSGLFTKLRHPMYTGFILWILGWIFSNGAMISMALGLICILCILYWRRLEEQKLALQFGDSYISYKKGTWF
jgi:protein-S-isoprenylcysteine O-methyltransferase Ste14